MITETKRKEKKTMGEVIGSILVWGIFLLILVRAH